MIDYTILVDRFTIDKEMAYSVMSTWLIYSPVSIESLNHLFRTTVIVLMLKLGNWELAESMANLLRRHYIEQVIYYNYSSIKDPNVWREEAMVIYETIG